MTLRCLPPMVLVIGMITGARAQVAVNTAGTAPNTKAMMDVSSTTKGLLVPRMTSVQRATIAVGAAQNGLVVYQTDAPNAASPEGYWYYDFTLPAWRPMQTNGTHWFVTGNAGTNPATDYVGTSDAQTFGLRTNNVERMRLGTGPNVMVPPTAPVTEALNITGAMRVNGAAVAPIQKGDIQWNPALSAHEGNVDATATGWYQLENIFTKRVAQPYDTIILGGCNPLILQIGTVVAGQDLWSTIETPYSTFWEDGRHQYLWLANELTAAGLCPNQNITALAFNVTWTGLYNYQPEIKLKNTITATMSNFDLGGLTLVYTAPQHNPVLGWNTHTFNVTPFQWDGIRNLLVEYCFNNYEWAGSSSVSSVNTAFQALYGSYCDACGGTGTIPCVPTIPPIPGCAGVTGTALTNWGVGVLGTGPCGPGCGAWCSGYSMTPGCMHTNPMNLITCDGTFQWIGQQGSAARRPVIRFTAFGGVGPSVGTQPGDYLHSSYPVMIGSAAWASGGVFPNQAFKGPGTLSSQVAVWGGITMLSDYVFDSYYDGQVKPEDQHGANFQHTPLMEMVNYVERERHLPTMDGRDEWQALGTPSMDHLTNQLWVTVEEQALYIKELNERMELLQKFLVEKRLKALAE